MAKTFISYEKLWNELEQTLLSTLLKLTVLKSDLVSCKCAVRVLNSGSCSHLFTIILSLFEFHSLQLSDSHCHILSYIQVKVFITVLLGLSWITLYRPSCSRESDLHIKMDHIVSFSHTLVRRHIMFSLFLEVTNLKFESCALSVTDISENHLKISSVMYHETKISSF